jgi:mRNA interferase RelE/StbE
MRYKIEVSETAAKVIRKLPRDEIKRIEQKINKLTENPRPTGVEKLSGKEHIYRIRSGDYRIIYHVQDKILHILVLKVGHRKEVYRDI